MNYVGIDVGAKNVKVVILKGGQVVARSLVLSGFDTRESVEAALSQALERAGASEDDLAHVVATGAGRNEVTFADEQVTEVTADTRGVLHLFPSARTVIDVGAEEGRGIKLDGQGKIVDFAMNEKCAAGAGAFTEAMARALEIKLEELGKISLQSDKTIPMNAQCTIFAESEVVSLIHAKTAKQDIARAVHDAMASRIISMVRRVGIEKDVALIGGVAYNVGFVDSMKRGLGMELLIPGEPEFVAALGAALIAAAKNSSN